MNVLENVSIVQYRNIVGICFIHLKLNFITKLINDLESRKFLFDIYIRLFQ